MGSVRTVAQDLKVKVLTPHAHDDTEIASAIQSAFKWNVFVPKTVTGVTPVVDQVKMQMTF